MAELPELETLRRELEKESVGKRFKVPEVVGAKLTKRNGNKKVFQGRLEGAKVKSVDRRGGYLVGEPRQRRAPPARTWGRRATSRRSRRGPPRPRAPSLTLAFTQGGQIRLVDTSGTAQAFVVATRRPGRGGARSWPRSGSTPWPTRCRGPPSPGSCSARNVKLKTVLMDQEVVAGHRPDLQRRDPLGGRPPPRPHLQRAVLAGDPAPVPGPGRDAPRGDQAPGHHGRRPPLRRPLRQARRPPGRAQGLRPRGRALPPLPGPGRQGPLRQQAPLLLRGMPGLRVLSRGVGATTSVQRSDVPQDADPEGLQVLRRHHRPRARTRGHRRGRAQRVRQVQRRRRHRLGARRAGAVGGALAEDGRRHLRRHRQAPGARARRGGAHHRQLGRACCRSSSPRSRSPARCSAPATASTRSTACRAGCSTSRTCCPTRASAASST